MRNLSALLSLPASLLLFLSAAPAQTSAIDTQWPYNLPPHVKYFPEDEPLVRRNVEIQRKLVKQKPWGVRKMGVDEGEMFYLEYWRFELGDDASWSRQSDPVTNRRTPLLHRQDDEMDGGGPPSNASIPLFLQPPLPLHNKQPITSNPLYRRLLRAPFAELDRRDFQCPTNTSNCVSVGFPNSCCPTGTTCIGITDTGAGGVGCCAPGVNCNSGQVVGCQQGYTLCPGSYGGGCCLPGYTCAGIGCILASTAVVVVQPTVVASASTSTSLQTTTAPGSSSTSSLPAPVSSASLTTSSSSPTSSSTSTSTTPPPSTSTSTAPTITCSPGFQTCASSLGGGCCTSGYTCGSVACIGPSTSTSSTVLVGAPIRPTSLASSIVTQTSSLPATITASVCPTGFYQCAAYYNAGSCCRVGRDCQLISCPLSTPTTVLVSEGITVLVASSATSGVIATVANNAGQQRGSCAQGWVGCPASAGGGCCPQGYQCNGNSCLAPAGGAGSGSVTASSVAQVATGTSGSASNGIGGRGRSWVMGVVVAWAGVGMLAV